MAVKTPAQGTGVLLITANVGSLFEDPENLQKNWLREFYQTVHIHKPHFIALHCQEVGGKNYEASMSHVDKFVKELLSSDEMIEYNRARVYLDENYKSQEHFTCKWSRKGFIRTRWSVTDWYVPVLLFLTFALI